MDDFTIEQTRTGIGDDCEIIGTYQSTTRRSTTRFVIQLKRPDATETTPTTIEGQLLHELDKAVEAAEGDKGDKGDKGDEGAFDRCLEKVHDVALSACETSMLDIVAASSSSSSSSSSSEPQGVNPVPLSLEQYLNPPTFFLQLITVDDHLKVVQHDDAKMSAYNHTPLRLVSTPYLDLGLPVVQASDVRVIEPVHFRKVIKVSVCWNDDNNDDDDDNNRPLIFKTAFPGAGGERELDREITVLHAISKARSSHPCLQIPQIRAIVVSSSGGEGEGGAVVVGFLADYLDACKPLSRIDIPATPVQIRARWKDQIQTTLKTVHDLNLAWGDVKTENVLIDSYQQAWLVDFAGSFTNGWVEDRLKETSEGDRQGLEKIVAFLDVDSK